MDEAVNMGNDDVDRLRAIRDVLDGKRTQVEAAAVLGRSERQVQRLCAKVRSQGNRGILHGLSGRASNNHLEPALFEQALSALHHPRWEGFRPTFVREKLAQYHGITLGEGTVRKLMIASGAWTARRRGVKHRAWRPRRPG